MDKMADDMWSEIRNQLKQNGKDITWLI
jgi:hypothetical protein